MTASRGDHRSTSISGAPWQRHHGRAGLVWRSHSACPGNHRRWRIAVGLGALATVGAKKRLSGDCRYDNSARRNRGQRTHTSAGVELAALRGGRLRADSHRAEKMAELAPRLRCSQSRRSVLAVLKVSTAKIPWCCRNWDGPLQKSRFREAFARRPRAAERRREESELKCVARPKRFSTLTRRIIRAAPCRSAVALPVGATSNASSSESGPVPSTSVSGWMIVDFRIDGNQQYSG